MPRQKKSVPLLIVVDMQWSFPASRDKRVIKAIEKQIDYFISHNFPIIFLEYEGHGRTLDCLREKVKDYRNKRYILKNFDNGGPEVFGNIEYRKIKVSEFVICGVNANACVRETLSHILFEINGDPSIKVTIPKGATRSLNSRSYLPLESLARTYRNNNVSFI